MVTSPPTRSAVHPSSGAAVVGDPDGGAVVADAGVCEVVLVGAELSSSPQAAARTATAASTPTVRHVARIIATTSTCSGRRRSPLA